MYGALPLLWLFLVFLVVGPDAGAQAIGDPPAAVEAVCGRPNMIRTTRDGDVWMYSQGARVTFRGGKVVRVEGFEDRSAGATERMTVVPDTPRRVSSVAEPATDDGSWFGGAPTWALIVVIALGGVAGVCRIGILIDAFKASPLWAFGCAFIPGVSLIFVITHWQDVKKTVLVGTAAALGCLMVFISMGPAPIW